MCANQNIGPCRMEIYKMEIDKMKVKTRKNDCKWYVIGITMLIFILFTNNVGASVDTISNAYITNPGNDTVCKIEKSDCKYPENMKRNGKSYESRY